MRIGFENLPRHNFHGLSLNRSLQKSMYTVYMCVLFGANIGNYFGVCIIQFAASMQDLRFAFMCEVASEVLAARK